ncbi:MAG: CBU_0592 family membrane protein [Streptosporangiales bacterium]
MVLDGAGWLGGIAVAVAYVLVATKRISPDARTFQLLNIVGGILLTATTVYRHALPNTVINIVWIVFGVYALLAARQRRRRTAVPTATAPRHHPTPSTSPQHGDDRGTARDAAAPQLADAR